MPFPAIVGRQCRGAPHQSLLPRRLVPGAAGPQQTSSGVLAGLRASVGFSSILEFNHVHQATGLEMALNRILGGVLPQVWDLQVLTDVWQDRRKIRDSLIAQLA